MRKPLIAGNWKMNNNVSDSLKFAATLSVELKAAGQIDVVMAPPFTALYSMGVALSDTEFKLAGQNLFWEDSGAFTGEVSGEFLAEIGCTYVIVGHSERRQYFGETNETVNKRLMAAIRHGLIPIMCVGENLAQRENGDTWQIIEEQLTDGLRGIDLRTVAHFVIAYEPVWAIGTGKTASPDEASGVHDSIRNYLKERYGDETAGKIRLIYGGSVTPANSRELITRENIDGALVGGASLDPKKFADIVRSAH
jgi:triosephosphate isomerase